MTFYRSLGVKWSRLFGVGGYADINRAEGLLRKAEKMLPIDPGKSHEHAVEAIQIALNRKSDAFGHDWMNACGDRAFRLLLDIAKRKRTVVDDSTLVLLRTYCSGAKLDAKIATSDLEFLFPQRLPYKYCVTLRQNHGVPCRIFVIQGNPVWMGRKSEPASIFSRYTPDVPLGAHLPEFTAILYGPDRRKQVQVIGACPESFKAVRCIRQGSGKCGIIRESENNHFALIQGDRMEIGEFDFECHVENGKAMLWDCTRRVGIVFGSSAGRTTLLKNLEAIRGEMDGLDPSADKYNRSCLAKAADVYIAIRNNAIEPFLPGAICDGYRFAAAICLTCRTQSDRNHFKQVVKSDGFYNFSQREYPLASIYCDVNHGAKLTGECLTMEGKSSQNQFVYQIWPKGSIQLRISSEKIDEDVIDVKMIIE